MQIRSLSRSVVAAAAALVAVTAHADPVSLVKLTGLVGSAPAIGTAVYKADLSTLAAASPPSSSRQQLAARRLARPVQRLRPRRHQALDHQLRRCRLRVGRAGVSFFDFVSGVVFTPGTQRAPADAKLFGTGPAGNTLDNAVATLGLFDGVH